MMFREVMVYCLSHTKPINTLCGGKCRVILNHAVHKITEAFERAEVGDKKSTDE
jgi:hypothetical protein